MSAHVLLNLLKELGKSDNMHNLTRIDMYNGLSQVYCIKFEGNISLRNGYLIKATDKRAFYDQYVFIKWMKKTWIQISWLHQKPADLNRPLVKNMYQKIIFSFLNHNMCYGCSNEQSQ